MRCVLAGVVVTAVDALNKLLEKDPRDAGALINRGIIHALRRDWERSRDDFAAADKIDGSNGHVPRSGWAPLTALQLHLNWACIEEQAGRYAAAEKHFERAADLLPDDAEVYMVDPPVHLGALANPCVRNAPSSSGQGAS